MLTLLPATAISARRRTILVFHLQPDGKLERLSLSRSGSGYEELYQGVWDQAKEDQWEAVGRLVRERDPRSIGINVSPAFAFGDGLTHSDHEELSRVLGPGYMPRTRGAERLAVGWLERRTKQELDAYPGIVEIVHGIVAEAFSSAVVHPGVTSRHAMELNARVAVPEWDGQEVRAALEEDIVFTGGKVTFLDGRQTSLYLNQ